MIYKEIFTHTEPERVYNSEEVKNQIKNSKSQLLERFKKTMSEQLGSGWVIDHFMGLFITTYNIPAARGGSYIETPQELKNSKFGLINIKNDDGDTALMLASLRGHNDIVKLIDAYDKIIKLKDLGGVNALDNLTGKKLPEDVLADISTFLTGKRAYRVEGQRKKLIYNLEMENAARRTRTKSRGGYRKTNRVNGKKKLRMTRR